MKIRYPAVAGSWYAGTPTQLHNQIEDLFRHKLGPGSLPSIVKLGQRTLVGFISPHAGYMASGPVAAHTYHRLASDGKPDVVVIFGPNHTGYGSPLAIMNEGYWRTPFGDVEIDTEVANKIMNFSGIIDVDERAHIHEHSIELQLPFLQYLYGSEFKFVPVSFMLQDLQSSCEVGRVVARVLKNKSGLVIASSDMTHYEPQKIAENKDRIAINAALKMDEKQYYDVIENYAISSCGYGPTIAAITAVKDLGAKKSRLLCYKTSGDILGDYSAVVGYASISFSKNIF